MPYITEPERRYVAEYGPGTVGQLNYAITKLILDYVNDFGLSYEQINAVIGALECAKLELYRRVAVPYETKKHAQNGDVYVLA